jgi:hypothetical protein
MSTWAAVAAKGAAATSVGAGISFAPGALDGFAVGALLTGLCFLVIIAPQMFRRSRLSARPSMWTASSRHARVRPDYYTAPDFATPELATPELATPELATPELATPELATPDFVAPDFAAPDFAAPDLATPGLATPADTYFLAAPTNLDVAATGSLLADEAPTDCPDQSLEVFLPAAGEDFGGHAGADPYASPYADAFGAAADDRIDLRGADEGPQESGRGYRSKHRMTDADTGDRRPEARRGPPRHAAPSARFGARLSTRLAMFPLVPARG